MTETFILRSEQPQSEQDVIVDWGDGNFEKVIDIIPTESAGEYRYTLTHTYSTVGTYIVKIFGKTYFSFSSSGSVETSLISRIFDYDLPIASHIWNLSSAFQHSNRLLHVNMWSHPASYQIIHWSAAFTSARNLIDCIGFSKYAHRESNYNIFQNCIGLVTTDLHIADNPADLGTGNGYAFTNCPKLTMNISSLLPVQGFKSGSTINIARLFKGCSLLSGTVPADKLWNNPDITWLNTSEAFTDCSTDIRAQVPISWGGTASDDIIKPKDNQMIIFNPTTVTDNTIYLNKNRNSYTITPTAATNITINTENLANIIGSEFHLIIDMSAGVQTLTFPSNFTFAGGTAPDMTRNGYYLIRTSYLGLGDGRIFRRICWSYNCCKST